MTPDLPSDSIGAFASYPRWRVAVCEHLLKAGRPDVRVPIATGAALRFSLASDIGGRRLALPVHDHVSLNRIDIDGTPTLDEIDQALDDWLGRTADACVLQAGRLADDSPIVAAARRTGGDSDAASRWRYRQIARTAWFDLDGDALPVPGKLRRNLARHERTLAGRGVISVDVADGSDTDALERAFVDFLTLEAAGWKGARGRGTAIADDPSLTAFYRVLLSDDPTTQATSLHAVVAVLRLDGRAIAAQFGLRVGTTLSLLKIAYDERDGDVSPGSLLLMRVMALARAEGIRRLSLVTSPAWATRWKPSSAPLWHVARYRPSAVGRTLMRLDDAHLRLKSGLRHVAPARYTSQR